MKKMLINYESFNNCYLQLQPPVRFPKIPHDASCFQLANHMSLLPPPSLDHYFLYLCRPATNMGNRDRPGHLSRLGTRHSPAEVASFLCSYTPNTHSYELFVESREEESIPECTLDHY